MINYECADCGWMGDSERVLKSCQLCGSSRIGNYDNNKKLDKSLSTARRVETDLTFNYFEVTGNLDRAVLQEIQSRLGYDYRGYGWPSHIAYDKKTNKTTWRCWGSCD